MVSSFSRVYSSTVYRRFAQNSPLSRAGTSGPYFAWSPLPDTIHWKDLNRPLGSRDNNHSHWSLYLNVFGITVILLEAQGFLVYVDGKFHACSLLFLSTFFEYSSVIEQKANTMLSEALRKASKEVMRLSEAGNTPLHELAERICRLLRLTALTSTDPSDAVTQVREQLRPFIPHMCILEAIAGRVLHILEESASPEILEPELNNLLEEVREANRELVEQTSAMFTGGDSIMILGNDEGEVLEAALRDAAEALSEDPATKGDSIRVVIVEVAPDHEGKARAMYSRLKLVPGLKARLIRDAYITSELRKCTKVVLRAVAMDVDDGCLCFSGSGIITAAANRMRIPVVLIMARYRIVPVGNASVAIMSQETGSPGKVWCYEEARDDRKHDPISVHSSIYDLVPLQKCEMVVTEYGGYSADYVKTFAVNLNSSNTSSPR